MARSHGLIRFRSPLLTESRLISFPPGTEMYQFPGFAPDGLCIQPPVTPSGCPVTPGCPIRTSPDQSLFGGSPELIAAFHVLHRLCTPRHPPSTLDSLTTLMKSCRQAAPSNRPRFANLRRPAHAPNRTGPLESNGSDTCVSNYELVKDLRAGLSAGPAARRPAGAVTRPWAYAPRFRSLEPTGFEPATSALQTRRSPG